jgi:hypothetical protein
VEVDQKTGNFRGFDLVRLLDNHGQQRVYLCLSQYIEFVRLSQTSRSVLKASHPNADTTKWPSDWIGPAETLTLNELVDALRQNKTIVGNPTLCRKGLVLPTTRYCRGYHFAELWTIASKDILRDALGWEHFSTGSSVDTHLIVEKEASSGNVWQAWDKVCYELVARILDYGGSSLSRLSARDIISRKRRICASRQALSEAGPPTRKARATKTSESAVGEAVGGEEKSELPAHAI